MAVDTITGYNYDLLIKDLSPVQIDAVNAIDDDVQIIACAGAGKTGVVTRRIINILRSKPDIKPENIVAFTFTRKAAEELRSRIYAMGKAVLGNTQGFADMYIGTIHGFCLQMLQNYLPQFQSFSVLDEIGTKLFIERYYHDVGMEDLDLKKYIDTDLFIKVMNLLNENWTDEYKWSSEVRSAFHKYKDKLYSEHFFDYSLILREMVEQIQTSLVFQGIIREKVKYLTIDEYQDTNPVQEKLVEALKGLGANICAVGDDDQTIYQFRGSDETNILTFVQKYAIRKYIVLDTNYRCTEGIVDVAKHVILNNNRRLPKKMLSGCRTVYDDGDIVSIEAEDSAEEYEFIASNIKKLHEIGVPYSEMAVLLRVRKLGTEIADVLEKYDIPFIIEGKNELAYTKECKAAKGIFDYLNNSITSTDLYELWKAVDYPFDERELADAMTDLMMTDVAKMKYYPDLNLQRIYHDFLRGISLVEDGRPETEIILYNLGKFSQVIADYETINYTLNPAWKIDGFCSFLQYTLNRYPEGDTENTYLRPDAVSIMTIHQAKGLEYAAVFIPGLNHNIFPPKKPGGKGIWHVIEKHWITGSSRFEGDLEDERKLFYVAVTRAKKYLFISRPKNAYFKKVSTFFTEASDSPFMQPYAAGIVYNKDHLPDLRKNETPIMLNFSILEDYFICPHRFKMSAFYGFKQPLTELLGYGNAIHSVIQNINQKAIAGETITQEYIEKVFDEVFFLPYATPKQKQTMLESAKKGVKNYVENSGRLDGVRMAEAQIEIDLGNGISVNGRMDMIRDEVEDGQKKTVIVDFKTANRSVADAINNEQLRIYALGYEHLTGQSADYLEIYHVDSQHSARRQVTPGMTDGIAEEIRDAAKHIRNNDLPRRCSKENCSTCHSGHLCLSKKEQKELKQENKTYG